jgi:hypothetical protein
MPEKAKPQIAVVTEGIAKPEVFNLDRFKSKRAAAMANVETLLPALPIHSISAAKDFARLHPDEAAYWSDELCFVSVPVQGQKKDTLHLIEEELAMQYLQSARIQRFRLALATKPHNKFFLCVVPSQNLDNVWNDTNVRACIVAKQFWTSVTSRSGEAAEGYVSTFAREATAFPEPTWPSKPLMGLIADAFDKRLITSAEHPALLRLIGASQKL